MGGVPCAVVPKFDKKFFCSQLSDVNFIDVIPDAPLKYNTR